MEKAFVKLDPYLFARLFLILVFLNRFFCALGRQWRCG